MDQTRTVAQSAELGAPEHFESVSRDFEKYSQEFLSNLNERQKVAIGFYAVLKDLSPTVAVKCCWFLPDLKPEQKMDVA